MGRRTQAREVVLQMLFQLDMNADVEADVVRGMIQQRVEDEASRDFAWKLFAGVMERRAQIDETLIKLAENWKLDRMATTDRNVLRLGAFELLFMDTPPKVAMDEAIELAKRFGAGQSSQFVNGILDRLHAESGSQEPDEGTAGETVDETAKPS